MFEKDTIVAQCTPSGSGALAIIRISGPDAIAVVDRCAQLSSQKKIISALTHTIHHGFVIDKNHTKIDEVLFFIMHGPKTFTGENVVEISTHNNPFIIQNVIKELINNGARLAQNGEFTRQAVLNNKMDLIKAEAINELIQANSEQLLKQSLEQMQGTFSSWIISLEKELLQLIGLCEASFEFIEEEINFDDQIIAAINKIKKNIEQLKKSFDQQKQLRQGIKVALIGSVNAGKSSLFNTLLDKKKAIVTNIPGTTRDVIEHGFYKKGTYLTLLDTAGLRETNDAIEKEGIEKSYAEAALADIILLVRDASRAISKEELLIYSDLLTLYKNKIILINNKIDKPILEIELFKNAVAISTLTKDGISKLEVEIDKKIELLLASHESPFLINKRHFNLLLSFETQLLEIEKIIAYQMEYELIVYHLKEAVAVLTELTGKTVSEKALDLVFKDFCVGK